MSPVLSQYDRARLKKLIKAVAQHVLDDGPAPAPLKRAWELKQWGGNIALMPEREFRAMSASYNVYMALSAYMQAAAANQSAAWARANPGPWNLVSSIIAERIRGE